MSRLFDNDELRKYHLTRNDILLTKYSSFEDDLFEYKTNETALDIFPNSIFNKKVSLVDENFVGFMMEMTDAKIVVFGDYEQRYDIPRAKAVESEGDVVLNMEWSEFVSYRIDNVQS
ncbi:hypothetical protein [Candidatus Nitrosocosmicus hydrocola]|jgi:hypothetical protein|uniref:hypothetical protein n=1 Tax=Candidatus Nitrosocosmicus hydrocola TaxID=1826872 RepID=UPI0011E5E3A9|nr:hypothetical protein [Candidatus Nitrosocosmicus hydrocola]